MKELINELYDALEEVVDIMQELMHSGGSMEQRRGRRRSGYRNGSYGSSGMNMREGSHDKEELIEALEEFMSQKYQ